MKYVNRSFTLPAGPGTVTDVEWKIAMGQAITQDEAWDQFVKETRPPRKWLDFVHWCDRRQLKFKEIQ